MQLQREQRQVKHRLANPTKEDFDKYVTTNEDGEEIINREICGFSDYEFEVAMKVLTVINSDNVKRAILMQHPKFKPLRDALRDFKNGNIFAGSD
jgi:hypothetical protein